ncbi:MAG: pyruvate dehydrogenase (acetyl-transferring) E1 component subunit alpha [Thermoprotei archaeon]
MIQYVDNDGNLKAEPDTPLSDSELLKLYKIMVQTRLFDQKALSYQRQGRIGFYAPCAGQEAAQVGAAYALKETDWVVPAYRELGAAFIKGYTIREIADQLYGNAEDILKGRQMPNHYGARKYRFVTASSPIATEIPHAVGIAMAAKYKGDDAVAMAFFGDGATSEGDFHVGLNFAGVYKAPVVFVCQNNQWAISMPVKGQTASETLAIKAVAYGIEGVRVDGNDLFAVYSTARKAVEKARSGGGPTLIEAVTYRFGPHSSSDDPTKYRLDEEVKSWQAKDPIKRIKLFLIRKGKWSEEEDASLRQKLDQEITDAFKEAERKPQPPLDSMFKDVYEEMTWNLKEELEEISHVLEKKNGSQGE